MPTEPKCVGDNPWYWAWAFTVSIGVVREMYHQGFGSDSSIHGFWIPVALATIGALGHSVYLRGQQRAELREKDAIAAAWRARADRALIDERPYS